MADLRNASVLLREVRERSGLVQGNPHRLFDVEVQFLLQTPGPYIVHDMRLPDHVYSVGLHLLQHLLVFRRMTEFEPPLARDAEIVPPLVQEVGHQIADRDNFYIIKRLQRGKMHGVWHAAAADHRDGYLALSIHFVYSSYIKFSYHLNLTRPRKSVNWFFFLSLTTPSCHDIRYAIDCKGLMVGAIKT